MNFSRIKNILIGLKNHVQDVWSFLDVTQLTFTGLSLICWMDYVFFNELPSILEKMDYTFLS